MTHYWKGLDVEIIDFYFNFISNFILSLICSFSYSFIISILFLLQQSPAFFMWMKFENHLLVEIVFACG